jgi:hypothetical protein
LTYFTSLRNTYSAGFTNITGTTVIKPMPVGWVLNAIEAINNGESLVIYIQGPNGASITWKADITLLRTIV